MIEIAWWQEIFSVSLSVKPLRAIRDLKEAALKTSSLSSASPLVEEAKDLLSLFPKGVGSLLSSLYPENVFLWFGRSSGERTSLRNL